MKKQDTLENQAKHSYLAIGSNLGNKIINIPKPKLLAGEESMNFICLLSDSSTLQIHSGKRFMSLKLKDLENYISTRAKRGMMLPQGYRKVDQVLEITTEDEAASE